MEIKWSIKYSVNVKEIDEQHRFFIELINLMREAVDHLDPDSILIKAFDLLVAYTSYHFDTEEELVQQCNYSGLDKLRSEHQDLLGRLDQLAKEKDSTSDIHAFYDSVLDFLLDWLNEHLLIEDMKFKDCLNENGIY